MAERPLYTLYKNLKAQNYDVPNDYNKFESALTRDGKSGADNRHAIYENLKAQNFDVPDTYERFYTALFEPRSKTSSRAKGGSVPMSAADRARFLSGAAAISASAKQTANNAGRYNRLRQRKQRQQKDFGRVNLGTHLTPFGGDANDVVKDEFAYNPETGKAGAYVTSDNENAYTQSDAEQKQAILDKYGEEWNKAVDMGMVPSELDKADPDMSDTDVAMRQMERRQEWLDENQNRRSQELNESMHLQDSPFVASGGAVAPSSFNAAIGNEANRLSDAEYGAYNTAKAYNQMLRTTLLQELKEQKQRNEDAGWWKDKWNDVSNYFGAMFNTMLDPKLYSQGVMDAAIASNLRQVKKGMEDGTIKKGSNAGNAAQVMLSAIQQQQGESAKQQQYGTKAYQYGDVSGRSLKFMGDFALSGWRDVMTTGFTKAGEKVGEKMALGALGKWFTKNTGRVLGDMAGSAALAATNQLGSTYNNVIERYVGMNNENGGVSQDKDGDLSFNKGVSLGKAIKDGFGSSTIENFSEMFGEYLPGASNLLSKLGLSKVSSFFEKIGNNAYYKWLSNATNKSGIQGVMAEISEEEFGTALHAAWGDGDGSWSDFNVFTNPDAREKQIDTCLGMFYSVGFMQSPRTAVGAINAVKYFNIKHQVTKADKFGQMMFGDNWDEIKSKIDVTTNADLTKTVLDATRSDSMTAKQKGAVINYAMFLSKLRGFNQASDAKTKDKVEEGETAPTLSNDLDDAYTEGHNADDADKHDIQIQHEDQAKTLAAALNISEQQLSGMSDEELESLTGQDDKLDQAIYDYQLSTARYQGVVDDAQDKVDLAAHQAEQRVNMYTDQSRGSVRNATIKASGGAEDYGVYIISGNIATHDDGSIDVSNSDDMILYFDPTTNSVEHADALMFAELGEELPADAVKAQAVADAKENAIKEVAGIIDGTVDVGSQFSVTDADGTEHTYEVLADNGDGTAMITIDGNVPTELVKGENVQIPYSFEDLQKMKDLEDQKRLEAAKTEREQMEKERAGQETEQTEESQPSFDFNQILNDNGNVVLVDVLGKDGNTKYPGSTLYLIRDAGAKAKVVELKSDGTLVPHAVNKEDVRATQPMSLDEYKQAFASSSMIEDNSGEIEGDRGGIEVNDELPPVPDNVTINGDGTYSVDGAVQGGENTTAPSEQTEQTPAITLEDGTIVPMLEDGNPDFSKLSAAQTAELYDTQFDEDADGIVSGYVSDAKKALDKANNMTVKGKTFVEQKAAKAAKEKAIADAQAAYDSAVAIRDAYNERQLAKEENTPEGRKGLIEKARRKFARLKNSEEWSERSGDLWNETVGKLLHRLYDATGIDVFNDTPNTVYEYVAENVGPYSLNYEGNDNSKGVQQETGLSRSDFAKLGWLAAEGKGMTIDAKVHRLWENRPSNLESADTQEIRNALISLITSGQTAFQARDYILNQRIELAESALEEQLRQEEDAAEARRAKEEEEKKKVELEKEKAEEEKTNENRNSPELSREQQKAKEEGEKLGFPAVDKEGEPINQNVIELANWAKEQGLEIDPTSKSNSYADLYVMCKDGFGVSTLVPDVGEDINQVFYFPDNVQGEQLLKLQEEFNVGRDLKHSADMNSELTEGAVFYDGDTAREFKEFVDKKVEMQNKVFGEQRPEEDLPFSAKDNGQQQTTSERAADVEKNKVDDMKVVDNIVGQKTRKAFDRLAKMMGANIQWQYSDKLGNGWIQETTDADGNVHRTIFITLDSSITEGAQFIFGHEMTHQIKNLNPAAYNELTQLVLDTYGSDAFDKAVDETMQRYSDAGFSGRDRDYYAEEVVADAVGEMIRDLNLAHTLAMKMSHPLLAAIHEILQKIKLAFYGTEYSDVTKNIIRSIEQAYVKTAKGEITNSETGENVSFSLRQKPEPKKKGVGYKVFVLKEGKLYPPMVANPDGAATPVGVWLDADAAPIAGESKTGRPQVKQGGKGTKGGSGKLAYRTGWHLGVVPYAIQFNRKDAEGNKTLFPKNFVFAEVEYAADVDYQEEARQEGINPSGKYQHSLAGLKHLPTDGYYMYRTNPNPETDPWVITGAMKVNRILTRAEQADLVSKAGREPQQIQEGDIVTDDVVNSINQEIADVPKFSLKVYHGSGADFTEFDFDHMGEGAGSQVFGWGGYVTSSEKIGKNYAKIGQMSAEDRHRHASSEDTPIEAAVGSILGQEIYNERAKTFEQKKAQAIENAENSIASYSDMLKNSNELDEKSKKFLEKSIERYKKELEVLRALTEEQYKEEYIKQGRAKNLYEVDIPDDNGSNYLDWENPLNEEQINAIRDALAKNGVDVSSWENRGFKLDLPFKDVYAAVLPMMMRCEPKEVSKFLSSLGFTGIKYPAGTIQGGAEEGDTNYVIFKPEDMRITEHTKFSIKTYHGSQASFDHFDHSFMGSGEGAQAYGWGTYVSEVEGIAKAYAKQNAAKHGMPREYKIAQTRLNHAKFEYDKVQRRYDNSKAYIDSLKEDLKNYRESMARRKEKVAYFAQNNMPETVDKLLKQIKRAEDTIKVIENDINMRTNNLEGWKPKLEEVKKKYEEEQKKFDAIPKPQIERNLYSVDIPDDTGENYLGWDEKMTHRMRDIRKEILEDNGYKLVDSDDMRDYFEDRDGKEYELFKEQYKTGGTFYEELAQLLHSQKLASLALKEYGFDGVKVIADRTTGGNKEGKMNYVIFDENNAKITDHTKFSLRLKSAIEETETNPSDAQKESGNYKKGHIKFGGYDYTIENPKGSTRSGKDADGKEWKVTMHDTYGYIRGKFGKDGDHLDMFINDKADLDNWNGDVFVVDQVNSDGSFDEHKVMYGYDSMDDAEKAYLANYSDGWQGLGNITGASKDEFDKWLDTSNRKLKPFADYAKVKFSQAQSVNNDEPKTFEEFLNHPLLKFSIKNEEQRKAAENAYKYASKLRPNKYAQYAIVDMSKPSKIPEYYEKKVLADNWRRFYNRAVHNELNDVRKKAWGNYKLFDLDRPFADQVNEVKGNVPDEFDAPDAATNKDNIKGLDRQMSSVAETRYSLKDIKPVGVGAFGNIYNQFRGKSKAAIEFLKKLGSGEATAALHHHTIGDISLVWGDKKAGLDKILRKHPEVVGNLQSIIDSMEVVQESDNRVKLESPTHFAVVSKEYKGEPREQWLLTAYEKRESLENDKSMDTATSSLGGDTALSQSKGSAAKIDNSSETAKENGEKFSLKDEKTLAGVHNITEEKLRKAIKQGGLANPSVAVIDSSKQNLEDYGDISLILSSDKVAKRTGKNAGTWQGDAWTPTYPQVERQMSNKGAEKASKDVSSVPGDMYREVRRGLDRWLDGGEANSAMAYMFLHEKGVAPEPKKIQHKFSDDVYNELKSITAGDFNIYGIGKADAQKVLGMYIDAKFDGDKDLYEEKTKVWLERNKSIVDAGNKGGMRYTIAKENVELYDEYGFNFKGVQTFVRDVEYDHRKTGVDMNATLNEVEDYIKTNNLTDEFNTWLEGKEKEYGIKEVIFDGFTPSGNRRYVPNTLENVSKIMKKQGRNGATGISVSFQNFAASLMPSYGTLKDIRSKKGLLTSDHEDLDKFNEKWSNVFFELGMKCQPDATGTFDDYGLARLSEAAKTSDPQAYLKKEYNVDFSDEDTKRLKEMVKAIKEESPAMYFETKFERPVGFNEFSSAVVPTTASDEVKQALQNAGVQIYEYDKEKEGDRSRAFNEAINSSDNIRFSLKSMMEKPEGWKQANKKAIHIAEAIERDPKFSLKNLDGTLIKAGTYFSGGGLVEEGLKGIIDPVLAVEYDEKISGVFRNNFGQHIVTADVRDVDPRELVKQIDGEVEYFHASPVCKNYSQAKSNHAEVELDKETAASTAEFINAIKPKVVTIENVKGYKDSEAMKTITDALDANGYTWDADVYNAADYGGYTNRERLIVRAVRDGQLPEKPKKMARKSGWYEAVADIIPTLTEKKNGVAPWMDIRLKADGIDWRNIDKPLYVMGSAYADGKIPHAFADELLPTLRTKSGDVIVMPDGKVYRAMGRVLARVSGVSDDYKMPFSENLSHTIIGNGIPTQLTEHVIAPLLTGSDPKFSIRTYHGTGAKFDKFDLSHALEGEGSESFGHGVYVTNSSKIGREYAQRAKQRKMADLYKNMRYPDGVKGDIFKRRVFGEMVNDVATGGSVASAKDFAKKRVGADANDIQRTLENLKDREKGTEYEQNLKDRLAEYKEGLKWIDSLDEDYLTQGNAYRYDVDIPDDNGSNYLDWKGTIPDSLDKQKVAEEAYKVVSDNQGFNDFKATPLNDFVAHTLKTYVNTTDVAESVEKLKSDIKGVIEDNLADDDVLALNEYLKEATPDDVLATIWYNDLVRDINNAGTGEELYRKLSTYVGDNAASQILSDNGLVGIKYPAGMIYGGAEEGDYNYVIFDENNANIVGNTKFSLRYDKFEHDLNQWKKDNNLPKDAQRPTIPQRNAGESAVDFLKRVDEYRKQMALWKTAPTYEQHLLSDDTALGEFNRELQRGSVLKRIAFQDSMLAIRKAQEAIMKEVGVDRLNMAEDAYTAENRSHGKGKNEFEEYNNEFLQPLRKAYHQMKKVLGDSYDNVRLYMMAKHGLERDAQMAFKKSLEADYEDVAQRSVAYRAYKGDIDRIVNDTDLELGRVDFTTWRQRDNALRTKYSPSYMNFRYDKMGIAFDYSGLSALFDGSDFEEAAHKLVRDIESKHIVETKELWDATNAATKKILRDGYKAGMMSEDTYQYVRDMYSHYIPLRGWDGTTADQVWDYIGGGKGAFNQTLKTAHGRTSIADDPIAYIENMAESGILLNNKNWVKQHLMLLAQNHPTSLLTLSKAWYVKSADANGNEEWIPATPQITSQMNSNQVKAAIDAFEQKMEQMEQTGDATQKRDGLNIAYPQTHSEEREHEVRVMKDGEEYVIYVNGDPQLAQAMNNTRAHRVREIQSGKLDRAAAWLGRKMAAAYTSLSPLFIPSNYFRDLTMTLASTAIREDGRYNYLLRKNLATSWNLGFMLKDYQNGKLREKVSNGNATPKEQMFYDFMMNGGETGFVSSLDVEDLKKKFKNDLKDLNRWKANPVKVGHTIMDSIEFLNRAIEDSNRFAIYMTSIQYGRSIDEAVNDAKDVTLNFNRNGTGEYGWQMIRNLYLFINPAVQSLQTLGALVKHHPYKFTAVTASWLASGVLVPIVNAALMSMLGGDDDKDKYWQFTKWDRRNNLIMWVPFTHEYVKIPLAQEFRAFYGVGDMIASKMMGGKLAEESWSQYAEDLLGQVVDMLPLDPTGYDGNIAVSLMPNAIRPVFELAFNVDFTGKPLFKDTEYNKYDPNFTKAYVGTPDWLVRVSKMVNSIGNDYPDVQQNSIDAFGDPRYNLNNPGVVDHILSSYLGGAYTMGSQVLGLLTKSLNDPKEIKVADIPLFSKFVSNPDDRPASKKQGDEFWDMKENHDRAANTLSKLKKQAKVDGDYSMLERFYGSEEYKQYKQDDVKVKKYEEDKKKERAEESGEEYRPHKLNAEDIYKDHATPKDDFEDLKLKQLYIKLNGFKSTYDLLVDTAPSQSDGYYNANKTAIDAIDEVSLDKQEILELKKGFLDDGKDAYNAEDMKRIRELRKKVLAVLEKANKVVVTNQKAKKK